MDIDTLKVQIKDCATFFYQNKEQEAYQLLNNLLPYINQVLQTSVENSEEYGEVIVSILKNFLEAYQNSDNLALADIMEYEISAVLNLNE